VFYSNYFQSVQLPYRLPVFEFQKANAAEVTENQKLPPGWVCITITFIKFVIEYGWKNCLHMPLAIKTF